jgi:hypothetical protein
MAETVQSDRELLLDGYLRVVGVVEEGRIILYLLAQLVKCIGCDVKDFPKVVRPLDFEDLENMGHLGWRTRDRLVVRFLISS